MADNVQGKKIAELDILNSLNGTESLIIESAAGTRRTSVKDLSDWIGDEARKITVIGNTIYESAE